MRIILTSDCPPERQSQWLREITDIANFQADPEGWLISRNLRNENAFHFFNAKRSAKLMGIAKPTAIQSPYNHHCEKIAVLKK